MKPQKSLFNTLKQRFRVVLFDEQSHEEISSTTVSRFQIWALILSALFLIFSSTCLLIAFSPLREYIPGYSPPHLSEKLVNLSFKTDSLFEELQIKGQKFKMLEKVIRGESIDDSADFDSRILVSVAPEDLIASSEDSMFREVIEREGRFDILSESSMKSRELMNIAFYAPLKGLISDSFNIQKKHFGIDVLAPINKSIKACLGGVVIFSDWTTETGYCIAIQHENNLISFYKHNSVLLKKVGDSIKAGDVIAIIGNSGEYSSGPHLHFELWHKGKPINPAHHILF